VHWGFAGEHHDAARPSEPGLYKIGLRYYDPDLGRWTQPDPLERAASPTSAAANPYAYAACDPVNLTDPTGLASVTAEEYLAECAAWAVGGQLQDLSQGSRARHSGQ
jgi:RHS repeat-associated protein